MDLSILIPARNEEFLSLTIDNILENIEADTEIIAVLDGAWADPPVKDHPRVNLIYHPVSVGQRAATNEAARIAQGKYVMKCDAHCAFGPGFDRIMIEAMQPDWTMVPLMYNLHAFDWVCQNEECDGRFYQGPTMEGCQKCGGPVEREILWKPKKTPKSTAMRFDSELKFGYWSAYKKHQKGDLVETMSLIGACWMLERDRYFDLNICDESWGNWGQQGTEVSCKTWLSGGRLICNKRTWFAHLFRTQGGDFGFPYPLSGKQVAHARECSQKTFLNNKWSGQVYPLSWLIEKFWPIPGWEEEDLDRVSEAGAIFLAAHPLTNTTDPFSASILASDMSGIDNGKTVKTKGILYYTDNRLDPSIMNACQSQLQKVDLPIVSVSLQSLNGFGKNIVLDRKRGPLTMFKQILAGLEALDTDIVFLVEHDVIYHPSHFEFTPGRDDVFYYNNNVWKVDAETGKSLFHYSNHTSQLCAHRELLLRHYRKRVEIVEANGFSRRMGYEPGTHGRDERVDDYGHNTWMSEVPNIDLRHKHNLTQTRWKKDEFRNRRFTKGWKIADEVPGWGRMAGRMEVFLDGLSN